MEKNVWIISGIHGAGKSTLKKYLVEERECIPADGLKCGKVKDKFVSLLVSLDKNIAHMVAANQIAKCNPNKKIIFIRSQMDTLAQAAALESCGYITEEQLKFFRDLCIKMSTKLNAQVDPSRVIWLHPDMDTVNSFIAKRRKEKAECGEEVDPYKFKENEIYQERLNAYTEAGYVGTDVINITTIGKRRISDVAKAMKL